MTLSFLRPASVLAGSVLAALLLIVAAGLAGCATTEDATDASPSKPEAVRAPGPNLAPAAKSVKTIQLYRSPDERNLPVTSVQGGSPLQLAFDLVGEEGRPLTIRFEHADRTWTRDLSPSQYLESFQTDNLLDYRPSLGTDVSYVHYTYQFPNDDIRFLVSGNYVLRVTEQGRPDDVLFERAFFLTEQAGALDLQAEGIVVSGQRQRSVRPIALFRPPSGLGSSTFGYHVCFVRNGRLPDTRCEGRPRLAQSPALAFELERDRAFAPTTADFVVDVSELRAGGDIERVDRLTSPFQVLLEPDYARFSGEPFASTLRGQILVSSVVRNRAEPSIAAEYADVTFALVPPNETRLADPVWIAGSFSGMQKQDDLRMRWNADRKRYEGTILLKQGRYEYFYLSDDPALQQALRQTLPRTDNQYTAFVYYEDVSRNTDRLLQVGSFTR